MKIELIGTGNISSTSNSACTLINDKILVDVPNGTCKALLRLGVSLSNIDACIITHLHGDHYFDIPFLLEYLKNENRETPLVLIGEKGLKEAVKSLTELAFRGLYSEIEEKLKFIECENLKEFELTSDLKITSYQVEHSDKYSCFGYLVISDGLKVGFTGDSRICDGVNNLIKKADILVADMSFEKGDEHHMGIDNIEKLADDNKEKTIVATHMKDTTRLLANEKSIKNVIIPSDGFVIEFSKIE